MPGWEHVVVPKPILVYSGLVSHYMSVSFLSLATLFIFIFVRLPAFSFVFLGHALPNAGRLEEAVSAYKKAFQRAPDHLIAHIGLATTYSLMGREEEARAEAQEVLRINPKFSLIHFKKTACTFLAVIVTFPSYLAVSICRCYM